MNYRRPLTGLLVTCGALGLTMAWGANPGSTQASAKAESKVVRAAAAAMPAARPLKAAMSVQPSSKSPSPASTPTIQPPSTLTHAAKSSMLVRTTRKEDIDPFSGSVIEDAQLATARGGTETNTSNVSGTVSGNVASQLTTGSNTIADGALANDSGVPMVIQNTGNNVSIQNSTILNLQMISPSK